MTTDPELLIQPGVEPKHQPTQGPIQPEKELAEFKQLLLFLRETTDNDTETTVTALSADQFAEEAFTPETPSTDEVIDNG